MVKELGSPETNLLYAAMSSIVSHKLNMSLAKNCNNIDERESGSLHLSLFILSQRLGIK